MPRISLDFDALPAFESSPIIFSLPSAVDVRLRALPAVYARCNAALRFNSWVGDDAQGLGVREEELPSMSAACLRAALMEYVGMEEALLTDLPSGAVPMSIRDTRNAMLIVLKELRNVQVHLVRTTLQSAKRASFFLFRGERHEHEFTALTIPRTDIERIKDSRNSAPFVKADYDDAVEWLVGAQEHWGITEVVMHGIWEYARAIVEAHVPVSQL